MTNTEIIFMLKSLDEDTLMNYYLYLKNLELQIAQEQLDSKVFTYQSF